MLKHILKIVPVLKFNLVNRMMNATTGHDEIYMTTPELITKHGYIAETHHVWTEDGYRLELHRVLSRNQDNDKIKNPKLRDPNCNIESEKVPLEGPFSKKRISKRPPILVNHGLLSSSADWVLLGPQKALAYLLVDQGYDVWLVNVRGNSYSQFHKKWNVKDREFWDFSFHEIALYDVPAMIDYILEKTKQSSLHYIGYSQGTTSFYAMVSEKPEYNAKVRSMISLAPIAFLANQKSPLLKLVVRFYSVMEWGSIYCNIHQWFPRNRLQARALGTFIRNSPDTFSKSCCTFWMYLVAGFGSNQLDKSMLPLIFGHFPAGASVKQIIHYSQLILSGGFRKFDHGPTENLRRYGSTEPSPYDLGKVKVPISVFYSENDYLTHPTDVKKLVDKLPNVVLFHKIEYNKFNHIDYLWGRDSKPLLYNHVVKALQDA
ncbi:lipase 3-like [Belonocnema kinseyi]|uniref:lipase 3-like n=1 Tax=Belonocnema kinseyi TaxID=2817044 RepID=UPI00143CF0CA|nr:lipase 3-like [Belonocnema kinseyi]